MYSCLVGINSYGVLKDYPERYDSVLFAHQLLFPSLKIFIIFRFCADAKANEKHLF